MGTGGLFAGVILANRFFKQFQQEQADMERAGVEPNPVSPGDPGFGAVPKWVNGTEVPHSFLSGGAGVRAAGEAEIASAPGAEPFGATINNFSGHFEGSMENLQLGVDAFAEAGITFAEVVPFE